MDQVRCSGNNAAPFVGRCSRPRRGRRRASPASRTARRAQGSHPRGPEDTECAEAAHADQPCLLRRTGEVHGYRAHSRPRDARRAVERSPGGPPTEMTLDRHTGVQYGASRDSREKSLTAVSICRASNVTHPGPPTARREGPPSVLKFSQSRPARGHLVHVLPSTSASEMSPPERHWPAFDTQNARICGMSSRQKRRYP